MTDSTTEADDLLDRLLGLLGSGTRIFDTLPFDPSTPSLIDLSNIERVDWLAANLSREAGRWGLTITPESAASISSDVGTWLDHRLRDGSPCLPAAVEFQRRALAVCIDAQVERERAGFPSGTWPPTTGVADRAHWRLLREWLPHWRGESTALVDEHLRRAAQEAEEARVRAEEAKRAAWLRRPLDDAVAALVATLRAEGPLQRTALIARRIPGCSHDHLGPVLREAEARGLIECEERGRAKLWSATSSERPHP
ncbi:hypothetical protein [Microbacterium sp. No. 7]|uniref:hypothetical protein n=1 Tax=Microbacterium sp. No. 7 TaxID=1714373 RepID=UPI0006D17DB9|nr:hypothetical protein [Microbacterium sp. No. 7]ALJ20643.1 hypothetical protein AOA12_12330 [Microbacterium sp. No. 7]